MLLHLLTMRKSPKEFGYKHLEKIQCLKRIRKILRFSSISMKLQKGILHSPVHNTSEVYLYNFACLYSMNTNLTFSC
jgi:hypothetical protein